MHQNTKLLLVAIGENYNKLMKLLVCSIENRECMIKRCPDCPKTSDALLNHLSMKLSDFEDDYIQLSQWKATGYSIPVQEHELSLNISGLLFTRCISLLPIHIFVKLSHSI